ncbi:MAG: squalene synthase HpnC [Solirubrobacterales bacterium]|nr:squalene synthase HpnC [Solirubrobacterales bacterium]
MTTSAPVQTESLPVALPAPDAIMDRAAGENFPVASRLLPRRQRDHLLAIYGFARLVDEAGDEAAGDRDALLDFIERELDRVFAGQPRHPLMRSLAATVRARDLPRAPLEALIEANRQDQRVRAYETFAELEAYCALSANPVGRLVLHVLAEPTPRRVALSDRICTALQLTEHWQDIAEDLGRGRIYVPSEDLRRFGCSPADLADRPAPDRVRELLRFEVTRAREILEAGAPLVGSLGGRPRIAVAAFVAGGRTALTAIERSGYDVSYGAPRASRRTRIVALVPALMRARGGSG